MTVLLRSAWGFQGPLGPPLTLPVRELWLHHSVTNPTDDPRADMRALERIGRQRFGRLSYSWAVHPNGTILQGQDTHIGAHTGGRNSTSMGVVAIGNYETDRPGEAMVDALARIAAYIGDTGRGPGHYTGGHRDVKQTSCPGRHLYAAVFEINTLARQFADQPPDQEEAMTVPTGWIGRGRDRDPVALVFSDGHKIEVDRSDTDAGARAIGEVFGVPFDEDQAAMAPEKAYDEIPPVT